ncbi:MAG: DNA polymerase III subunit delta [Deltaproteobacteria bacterium]|nr:DNA polymerase III subunit delta [Deltaproteobacteria bacterium]
MNPKQALADLQKGETWPVYFLYGDEPYKIDEFIANARTAVFGGSLGSEYSVERIDGSVSTGSAVVGALQSMELFGARGHGGNRKIVIVRQAAQLKEQEPLADAVMGGDQGPEKDPWGGNVLILVSESLDGRRKFHQWLKKKGYALEFARAKDTELSQWARYIARKFGVNLEPGAAELLVLLSDGSLFRLEQEIEKSWLHAGGASDATIRREDVAAVASREVSHEMVELVDAILDSKRTRAMILCEKLIRSSEDALGLTGFLAWGIKNPMGKRRPDAARNRRLLARLLDLDLRLKSTGLDARSLIDQFVVENTK